MNVLELFAGSRSIGNICDELGYNVFSSDINAFDKIDYVTDINTFDVLKVPFIPDFIWASPPCTYFSVASIGKHWNKNHTPKSDNALKGVQYVKSTLEKGYQELLYGIASMEILEQSQLIYGVTIFITLCLNLMVGNLKKNVLMEILIVITKQHQEEVELERKE